MAEIDDKLVQAETCIREVEHLYDNFKMTKEAIKKYKGQLVALEKYVSTQSHKEWDWDRSSERATALSYAWDKKYKLLKARIIELKAVLSFAEDDPVKAKEYALIAQQKLPTHDDALISGLGHNFRQTDSKGYQEWEKIKKWLIWIAVAVAVVLFLKFGYAAGNKYGEEAPDYCDTALCK